MAYYRRSRFSRYRRRPFRRFRGRNFSRIPRRSVRIPRRRLNQNTPYRFSRVVTSSIRGTTSGAGSGGIAFVLSDLPTPTDFTALFDFYRIRGVSITFIPRVTQTTSPIVNYGNFYWVVDYDDVNTPTLADLEQKQGVRVKYYVGKPWRIFFRPKPLTNIYNGAASSDAHQVAKFGWINAADTGVPHYGLKWAWDGTSDQTTLDLVIRYYVEFKGVQ